MEEKIKEIKTLIDIALKGRTPQELFLQLREVECPKPALMIIDSTLKGMDIAHLPETLLIRSDCYELELQNATIALNAILNSPQK